MVGFDNGRLAVIGAGEMGHGITEVAALAGYDVAMRDVDREILENGYDSIQWSLKKLSENGQIDQDVNSVLSRITTTTDLKTAIGDADLVIEAIPEDLDLKHELYRELEGLVHNDVVLASNTSSLRITNIAEPLEHPSRVVGLHFFNPPVKMDLVEVVHGEQTSEEVAEAAVGFVESIGKTPISVKKDVRGFVVNSVLGPFIDEPAWMVSEGEATIREADATMVHDRGYPMGPFELADLTGIDVNYHVREQADRPIPEIMAENVNQGHVGRKAGKGYYDYEDGDGADYEPSNAGTFDALRVEARMINEAGKLVGNGVATPSDIDTGVRLGANFPEGITKRADEIGLDVVLEKLQTLYDQTDNDRYEPSAYIVGLVNSGRTGKQNGAGFHDYDATGMDEQLTELSYELTDDGLLSIELDKPDRLNALSPKMKDDVETLLSSISLDDVRCAIISGAGEKAFSAGADIDSFENRSVADAMTVNSFYETVNEFPRPTLAAIDGYCLGAGLELALACDLRVATQRSEFGFPEIRLGLIPGGGGTQRALRVLGETRVNELVYRGNHIDADTAESWGLVNRSVPLDEFNDTVDEFVDDLLTGPPLGLQVAKSVIQAGGDSSLDSGLVTESQGFGLLFGTDDATEGQEAYMENRDPKFEGT